MCDQPTGRQLDDSPVSDDTLAERARSGSGAAFAALVRLHGEAVYAIARNMSVTARDAEEVLQQTFLSAWRDLGSLPAGARFTTWLYGIAMKTAFAHRQAHRHSPWGSLEGLLAAARSARMHRRSDPRCLRPARRGSAAGRGSGHDPGNVAAGRPAGRASGLPHASRLHLRALISTIGGVPQRSRADLTARSSGRTSSSAR